MKSKYGLLPALVAIASLVAFSYPCWAEQPAQQVSVDTNAQQAPTDTNKPAPPASRFEPDEAAVKAMMERLASADPQRAEELEKLRQTDPEEFKRELGKVMRDMAYWRTKNRDEQGRQRHRPAAEVPFAPAGERERGPSAAMRQVHEEYLQWLQDNYPDEAKELAKLKEQNPQLYMRKLALSFKTYGKIAEVARENPELAGVLKEDLELRKQSEKLLGRIKAAADEGKKQQLVKELEGVTNARFDLIVKRTQIQYEQLNKKLEQLKEEVKENAAKVEKWKDPEFKKQSVKARMEEMLSETEKFNWE
jgi:uncharacterized protein YukE